MLIHNPFGPIFSRELRATSRRRRSYVLRVAFLGGLLLFLVLTYSATGISRGTGGMLWRAQRLSELGQGFFICFALFSAAAMTLIGPLLTCTAISSERLHKTLPVLLMTPISAWQIVTGKLFSRLLIALMLLGLSLPVLAVVRLLGGVELREMFAVLALCASMALLGASLGLLVSTFINRAYSAILFSYAGLLLVWVLTPILIAAPYFNSPGPSRWALASMMTVSPLLNLLFQVMPGGMGIMGPWTWCVAAQVTLAGTFIVGCTLALRWIQRREGSAEAAVQPNPEVAAAGAPPVGAPRRRQRRRREVSDNPVLWRELHRPLFAKRWQSVLATVFALGLLLFSYAMFGFGGVLDDREVHGMFAVLFNLAAWASFAVLSATIIAQEKESDTWTILLATPLSGRRIVWGKILGIYRRAVWPTLLVVTHFSIFAVAGVLSWMAALMVIWIILSFNTIWVATGVLLSLDIRKVTMAVIVNLSGGILLYLILPLVLLLAGSGEKAAEFSLWSNPYFYLTQAVDRLSPEFDPSRRAWLPAVESATAGTFVKATLTSGCVHILLALGIVLWTVNRFNALVGRAENRGQAARAAAS